MISAFIRILTGKRKPQMKPHCLQKEQIWTFGSLVRQINAL